MKMKFLLLATESSPAPPDSHLALYQASKDWVKEKLSDKTLDCAYGFVQGLGFAIANANSHEELLELLQAYPLYGFITFDIKPLVNFVWALEKAIEYIQKQTS